MFIRLFRQRTCCVPTPAGWLVLATVAVVAAVGFVNGIHPFLAENRPVRGKAIIVEGWVPDYALERVVQDFRRNGCSLVVTTGGPLSKGFYLAEYQSLADVTAATLVALGLDSAAVRCVPAPLSMRDRTYESACAVARWMKETGTVIQSADLYTFGPHSRRSRLLFRRALGDGVTLGAVALPSAEYDAARWWASSTGFRFVTDELIAYLYAVTAGRGQR